MSRPDLLKSPNAPRPASGRRRRVRASGPTLLLAIGVLVTVALPAPAGEIDEVAAAIRLVVEAGRHPELRWQSFPRLRDELVRLYEPGGYAPIWLEGSHPRAQARDVVEALVEGAAGGLDPEDYDASWLDARLRALGAGHEASPRELGMLDAALSVALARQILHRHQGRVDSRTFGVDLDIEHKKVDVAALVRQAIDANRVRETVQEAEPRLVQVALLKQALARYRAMASQATAGAVPKAQKVEPGAAYAGAPALRRLLLTLGDLPAESAAEPGHECEYTLDLAEGVKHFQKRHGLSTDGILGAETFAELNTPLTHRVRQIELALERLRWLPDFDHGPLIMVDIPAFRLWGWGVTSSDQLPVLTKNVVVGRALGHATPLFTKEMQYVIFYPTWAVPYSITRGEIVPKLRKDPSYLASQNMELVRDFAQDGPSATDSAPAVLDELLRGTLKVRQRSGPANSLGLVKFVFPNDQNIYIHDTPFKSLFGQARRDLSHGCVRVQDPAALAELVLASNGGWTGERIAAAMKGPQQRVDLKVPVPVFIFYTTAYTEPNGNVHFLRDVYGHDQKLEAALHESERSAP